MPDLFNTRKEDAIEFARKCSIPSGMYVQKVRRSHTAKQGTNYKI